MLIALQTVSPAIGQVLQWQASDAENLQAWWRPFTAHLVHTNLTHLLMNLLGLWLVVWAACPLLRTRQAITLYLLCCVAIGLTLPASGLGSYRGLSGVLYGIVAWLSVASWRSP
ncbi:MAG: rhomboid family intramembrane serine protease, partial [Plesiomonas shigelloides]